MKSLPDTLHKQYNHELVNVSGGTQLLHSPFFQVRAHLCIHVRTGFDPSHPVQSLVALACDFELDTLPVCAEPAKWAWFSQYCLVARMARSLQSRTSIPPK